MSKEEKSKGKAAVDLVGSQIGKSGASWITQALLLITGSIQVQTLPAAILRPRALYFDSLLPGGSPSLLKYIEIPGFCIIDPGVQAALPIISGVYLLVITAWIRAVAILGSTIKVRFRSGTGVPCAWHAVTASSDLHTAPSQCITSILRRCQSVYVRLVSHTHMLMMRSRRCRIAGLSTFSTIPGLHMAQQLWAC